MFGFLGAIIDLITSIISGVFGLITSCLGSCLGLAIMGMILVALAGVFFLHLF